MVVETKKILDPKIKVTATCVRVPVFIGHAEAINIEFESPISPQEARAALSKQPGIIVVDHRAEEGYVTPVECAGEDAVYVSRVWVLGDIWLTEGTADALLTCRAILHAVMTTAVSLYTGVLTMSSMSPDTVWAQRRLKEPYSKTSRIIPIRRSAIALLLVPPTLKKA